jgi:hypothetical protein
MAEIMRLCREFLETATTRTGLSLQDETWMSHREQQDETAFCGVVLSLASSVNTLLLELSNKAGRSINEEGYRLQTFLTILSLLSSRYLDSPI